MFPVCFVLVDDLIPISQLPFLVAILANQIIYICAFLLLRQVIYFHIVVATKMHLCGHKGAVEFHHLLVICESHRSIPGSPLTHNNASFS